MRCLPLERIAPNSLRPVSYTHLDVYKRQVQLLLGHTKMDSTVRYLGVDLNDALSLSEGIDL